jgi:hypothetical protein
MVGIVASWRCQCGTRVKVIAEADSTPASATKITSCPSCGRRHPIHADKIISVTEDMSEGSPAAVPCAEKDRLLVAQNNADDLNVDHWIHESLDAAKQTGYKSPPIGDGAGPFTVTLAYKTAARNLAERRIALAGARLAKMLDEELK